MEPIISAIDELKGGKDWRTLADDSKSKALRLPFGKSCWVVLHCTERSVLNRL